MRVLPARVLGLLRGRRLDADLDDEMRFHLDMAIDEYVRQGLSRDDARCSRVADFGGVMQVK